MNKNILIILSTFLFFNACIKSRATIYINDPLNQSMFKGIEKITDNADGTYQLAWQPLSSNLKIAAKAKYGVFFREIEPTNLWNNFLNLFSGRNEYSFDTPLATVNYDTSTYTTSMLAFKNNTCFVVRVINAKELHDVNTTEKCTGHTKIVFAGIKAATLSADNRYNISWDKVPFVPADYNVFMRNEVSSEGYDFTSPTVVINNDTTSWQSEVINDNFPWCFLVTHVSGVQRNLLAQSYAAA